LVFYWYFRTWERPLSVLAPPPWKPLIKEALDAGRLVKLLSIGPLPVGKYLHWNDLRHRTPPDGLSPNEWWAGVKLARSHQFRPIPLHDPEGKPFAYWLPEPAQRLLHEIDRAVGGRIEGFDLAINPAARDRYIVSSLIDEAITSSQMEGASTTKRVAEDMLRSGRSPRDRSERMILNNFRALAFVRDQVGKPLTTEMLFDLHRIVTDGTLDDPDGAGRFRDSDDIVIEDARGRIVHRPPPAATLPERVSAMVRFANERSGDTFFHPVVRAITLHFWLGYDHPFVDGNGRTARALFYWSMLSEGYGLTEFLSISPILRKATRQYGDSFLQTETDDNDLTYFILYQLEVIHRAIEGLRRYLSEKKKEAGEMERRLSGSVELNHRQLALLRHALKHPAQEYTIQSHGSSHRVVYETARTDLLELERKSLLVKRKRGKAFVFMAVPGLDARLRDLN
jgi:Fic family protein